MDATTVLFPRRKFSFPNSQDLSTPEKTRQTRHLLSKLLRALARFMSGRPENPTPNPTFHPTKPDISGS